MEASACATGLAALVRAVERQVLAALQAALSAFFAQVPRPCQPRPSAGEECWCTVPLCCWFQRCKTFQVSLLLELSTMDVDGPSLASGPQPTWFCARMRLQLKSFFVSRPH